jgi:N-methylhydantoinase B
LKDVRNELISLTAAAQEYGVAIDTHNWKVDEAATQRRRADIRAARGWSEVPTVLWDEPPTLPIPTP